MCHEDILREFDPNGVGSTCGGIFGLPFAVEESKLVVIPMPWDVTVSNLGGTSRAPAMILINSSQIDLYDPFAVDVWKQGIASEAIDPSMVALNDSLRGQAATVIQFLEYGGQVATNNEVQKAIKSINAACMDITLSLEKKCTSYLDQGKIPLVVGGDHSVSLGNVRAVASKYPGVGILQIDAHADLRDHYMGFSYSHASIMRNILATENIGPLVQTGIRELCEEEIQLIDKHPARVFTWYDRDIFQRLARGDTWDVICHEMIHQLPDVVYISFDIDGLEPPLCPNTGTPVPGGLTYNQAMYLLEAIVNSGRQIVGADLVETGADTFDAMIACRILYRMAGMMIKSVKSIS